MIKKEILEIRHRFAPTICSIDKICGCYVDGDRKKVAKIKEAFLSLPEEESYKYFEIFKKNLSGAVGRNLITCEFPTEQEFDGGTQQILMELRKCKLDDDILLDKFYDTVIEHYDYTGNYLILLIHDNYDVPGRTTDGIIMDDASDEVYEYIMCSICHVNLSKPGLSYFDLENTFHDRIRDWIVDMPDIGFLFPAFTDRSADIHNVLYYTRKPEELHYDFLTHVLGTSLPITAGNQKEAFHSVITETLGTECSLEAVKNIHDNLKIRMDEQKDNPEPFTLSKTEIKNLLSESGVSDEKLVNFDDRFMHAASPYIPDDKKTPKETDSETSNHPKMALYADNISSAKNFEVKTTDVVIKVNPDRTDLIEMREIDGRRYIMVEITDNVSVNGIPIKGL